MPTPPNVLTGKRKQILRFIDEYMATNGFPPSVREIGEAVDLSSSSSVHSHLKTLHRMGYLKRQPDKPRALEVRWDSGSNTALERRPARHVPLIGDVAAGTDVLADENLEEMLPLPQDFTGDGNLFMLRVRGQSMINVGIMPGDYVVVSQGAGVTNGDIVVAGIPGDEATVKTFQQDGDTITLVPANDEFKPMVFRSDEVRLYGKVVTVVRRMA